MRGWTGVRVCRDAFTMFGTQTSDTDRGKGSVGCGAVSVWEGMAVHQTCGRLRVHVALVPLRAVGSA